jgi:hypothetical protein
MPTLLRLFVAGLVLVTTNPSLMAQKAPANVCVAEASMPNSPEGEATPLARAVSKLKLRSGRAIAGIALRAKSETALSSEIRAHDCDYLVRLRPSGFSQGGMNNANDAVGSPSAAGPAYDRGLDYPLLTYELYRVGEKRSVARGMAAYQHTGLRRKLEADYRSLAVRIVQVAQ